MSLPALRSAANWGLLLYLAAALADAGLTHAGLDGSAAGEGNPFLRALMERVGIVPALAAVKGAVGLLFWKLALFYGAAVHNREPWIWRIPSLPPVRRWMRSGDRCWTALAPLYGVALAQALAAASWLLVGR